MKTENKSRIDLLFLSCKLLIVDLPRDHPHRAGISQPINNNLIFWFRHSVALWSSYASGLNLEEAVIGDDVIVELAEHLFVVINKLQELSGNGSEIVLTDG